MVAVAGAGFKTACKEATAEEAHAIAADRLGRVEVDRGASAGGVIRLTTEPSGKRQRLTVQAAATRLYDEPRAANGVILIVTTPLSSPAPRSRRA